MSKLLRRFKGNKGGRYGEEEGILEWMDLDEEDDADYDEDDEEIEEDVDSEDESYDVYGEASDEDEPEEEDADGDEDEGDYEDEENDEDIEDYEDEENDEDIEDYEDEEYDEDIEGYEDEEYDEDEEDYEDEEYDEDEDDDRPVASRKRKKTSRGIKGIVYWFSERSAVDYIVMLTGAAVLILGIFTAALLVNNRNMQKQVEAFAEVGIGIEDINIIGYSGLVAIADAQAAKVQAAMFEEEAEKPVDDEIDRTDEKTAIFLNLTSIQKDLKIKFTNEKTGKLIANVDFEVQISPPSGSAYTKKDDDKDGIIYLTEIPAGRYEILIVSPKELDSYTIPTQASVITVRDTIEYKKVDVSDEVKTESQVNVAVEDTKVNETVVESANTDTVEWVESTKTLIEGTESAQESWEKVDKNKIADPGKSASLDFRLLAAENVMPLSLEVPSEEGNETPTPGVSDPEPEETETPESGEPEKPTDAPTQAPQEPDPTPTDAEVPAETPKPDKTPEAQPSDKPVPTATPAATAAPTPTSTPAASPTAKPTPTSNKAANDTTSNLKTTDGEQLYVKDASGNYREAKYADYYKVSEFYRKVVKTTGQYRYTGWQQIDGATYFFDKNGNKVTGEQVIQGAKYTFNSDGSLNTGSGHLGIDVSKWNGNINWTAVKNSGVSYVIIRCGYRGSTTGALIEDPMFKSNIQGAQNAGLKVGIYFFTQAVNEVEAVEEASMVLGLIKGYNITYPVFLDVESANGRADGISVAARTAVCRAFCQTIQNSGYKAGIYANKTWLNEKIDTPSLTGYRIWLAQYAASPSYTRTKYDMWQYSSKGSVSGISGNTDMNISYMGY